MPFEIYQGKKSGDVKHIIAFSDTCGGQNRNFNVASFWIYCINCELDNSNMAGVNNSTFTFTSGIARERSSGEI